MKKGRLTRLLKSQRRPANGHSKPPDPSSPGKLHDGKGVCTLRSLQVPPLLFPRRSGPLTPSVFFPPWPFILGLWGRLLPSMTSKMKSHPTTIMVIMAVLAGAPTRTNHAAMLQDIEA